MPAPRRIALIGAGRVGTALVYHLRARGERIVSIHDRDPRAVRRCWRRLGLAPRTDGLAAGIGRADTIIIAVPDRALTGVARAIAPLATRRQVVLHTSGVFPSSVLRGIRGPRLAFHPAQTFPDLARALRTLPGAWFALEGDRPGLAVGRRLARKLGGRVLVLGPGQHVLYHAMCVWASGFLAVLFDAAEATARAAGIAPSRARTMIGSLARRTLANALELGPAAALSGPIERGDDATVAAHLAALGRRRREIVPLYQALARRALVLARRRRALDARATRALAALLKEER